MSIQQKIEKCKGYELLNAKKSDPIPGWGGIPYRPLDLARVLPLPRLDGVPPLEGWMGVPPPSGPGWGTLPLGVD